jgi:hypothetical protein
MVSCPSGPFSGVILAGLWSPTRSELLASHQTKRGADSQRHRDYADRHRSGYNRLADQKGHTAQDTRETLADDEAFHYNIATGHDEKVLAYKRGKEIHQQYVSDLRDIDDEAHEKIKQIQQSKLPEPEKIEEITKIVTAARDRAMYKASGATSAIMDATTRLLQQTGQDKTAHDLVQALDNRHQKEMPPSTPVMPDQMSTTGGSGPSGIAETSHSAVDAARDASANGGSAPPGMATTVPGQVTGSPATAVAPPGEIPKSVTPPTPPLAAPVTGTSTGGVVSGHVPSAPSVPAAVSPGGLAGGVSSGMGAGAPASVQSNAAANAVVSAATQNSTSSVPSPPPPMVTSAPPALPPPTASPVVASGPVVHDVPAAPPPVALVGEVASTPATTPAPFVAPSPVAPPPVGAVPPPPGPLPAYGSDIRIAPPAPAVPASPAPTPVVSSSATTAPPGSAGGLGAPAVVRSSPAPPPPPVGGPWVATASASAGIVTGAAAAQTARQQRCDDLLVCVARQEPRLRWAVAANGDEPALLVTDLAGGWVPPQVRTPRGVRLLPPAAEALSAKRSVQELLGDREFRAVYTPGQQTSEGSGDVEISDWPREVDQAPSLGWELRKATEWRNGLAQIAHTVAKAWAHQNPLRDVELEALTDQLETARSAVLNSYRDGVDLHLVGNWMLLAAIDAAASGARLVATYHFRWYSAVKEAAAAAGVVSA